MKEKVLGLFSGGIDSPVACMLASREFEVIPLHFCLYPMASKESSIKALTVLDELKEKIGFKRAIIFPWAGFLEEVRKKVKNSHICVACRRGMLEIASRICNQNDIQGIVTGESLGQKASQTIENISAISSSIEVPILRPVLAMNKDEIIRLSKELSIWRADHSGCCLVTPQRPRTKASSQEVEREMKKIDLDGLMDEAGELTLDVGNFDWDFEDYLFKLAGRFE